MMPRPPAAATAADTMSQDAFDVRLHLLLKPVNDAAAACSNSHLNTKAALSQ
jgi:hypothetical protein